MMWAGYNISQAGENFCVEGDWPGEVWQDKEGNPKNHALYRPGDVFIVNEDGWLCKVEDVTALMTKYEASKNERK